jgi:excinuclease UvrABC ATPase subunit
MEEIKKWIIDNYLNEKLSFNSCLFISGVSGSGKSYLINKIIKDMDLFLISINSNNCSSSTQLIDLLMKSFISSLIQILTNNTSKKIAIIKIIPARRATPQFQTILSTQ